MQPFIAAMLKVRQAFYAAIIRSLLRTKSVLQTILNIWIAPSLIKGDNKNVDGGNAAAAAVAVKAKMYAQFIEDVETAFRESKEKSRLVELSDGLRKQFGESLLDNPMNMLPSYNHQLPTGDECGTYLALDVGGSTFRIALIELSGRKNGSEGQECHILKRDSYKISSAVKQLKGILFFDWMAERIGETLAGHEEGHDMDSAPLSMGMSWSFPIE